MKIMEKKTIGQFIAVLRKANGMTQRQLAEKLNVSDKAVSRWERDECLPDLTLVPVLAEIFGVTSDEILRGEKANPDKVSDEQEIERNTEKTEKQVFRLLDATETKHRISGIVSISVAAVGLIVAMICNLGFNRAYLGFFISSIFYLGAVIYQIVSIILAFSSIRRVEFAGEELNSTRRSMFNRSCGTIGGIFIFFAVSIPLMFVGDAYYGLRAFSWIVYGFLFGVIGAIISNIARIIAKNMAVKKGVYCLSEEESHRKKRAIELLTPLKKRLGKKLLVIILVGFVLQLIINLLPVTLFTSEKLFDDLESFKEYIETPVELRSIVDDVVTYAEWGKDSSYLENIETSKLCIGEKDGEKQFFRYKHRNEMVALVETKGEGDELVVVTYTHLDMINARNNILLINVLFLVVFVIEVIVFSVIYIKKRKAILAN